MISEICNVITDISDEALAYHAARLWFGLLGREWVGIKAAPWRVVGTCADNKQWSHLPSSERQNVELQWLFGIKTATGARQRDIVDM
jgi:hypothetical protein